MQLRVGVAFANRLSQLAYFFSEPRDGGRNTTSSVTIAVRLLDQLLQLAQVHTDTVEADQLARAASTMASICSIPCSPDARNFTVPSPPMIVKNGKPLTP